jgi:branched-subunit amino acid ABC-type transport system permease component
MKPKNVFLIVLMIMGSLAGITGTALKIFWAINADVLLLVSLIMLPVAVIGLIISNLGRIRQALR